MKDKTSYIIYIVGYYVIKHYLCFQKKKKKEKVKRQTLFMKDVQDQSSLT
jgi:hypothetical protein